MEDLIEQAFHQYGLVGLIVTFLVLGPGYTYLQTRDLRLKSESQAQNLLNTVLMDEMAHGDTLEEQLTQTQQRLEEAKGEVFQLQMELAETKHKLDVIPENTQQIDLLEGRMSVLEKVVMGEGTTSE